MKSVTLQQLAEVVPGAVVVGEGGVTPGGLNYDSREVVAGDLFVAIPGERFDGHDFVAGAMAAGAAAVVIQADRAAPFADLTIPRIIVPDVRRALAPLSCRFYDNPTRRLYLTGVTGTNGKTTTTLMIDSINRAQFGDLTGTGTIGTLGATIGDKALPHDRTTPEAPDLQRLFRQMRDAGVTFATMEVASHALALGRTEGCLFNVGVFTNLTQDHLDFHGTMEAYRDAKALLFTEYAKAAEAVGKPFHAVINVDDEAGRYYVSLKPSVPVVTYGLSPDYEAEGVHTLHITATDITLKVDEITFTAIVPEIPQNPTGEIAIRLVDFVFQHAESTQIGVLYLTNLLAILFSMGLAIPWAVVRSARYRLECLALETRVPMEQFVSGIAANVSATGEELGEFFNIDLSL